MNFYKRVISAVSAVLLASSVSAVTFANAADVPEKNIVVSQNDYYEVPDWVPKNYIEALDFTNTYGATFADGEYACIVQERSKNDKNYYNIEFDKTNKENGSLSFVYNKDLYFEDMDIPEAPDKEKDEKAYLKYMDEYGRYSTDPTKMEADNYYKVIVFSMMFTDVDVTMESGRNTADGPEVYSSTKYSFGHTSSTLITEQFDVFGWAPDSTKEYNEFRKKYGTVSVHGDYVIYCDDVLYSAGTDLEIENSAPDKLKQVASYNVIPHYPRGMFTPVGSADHVVKIFKAADVGDVNLKFTQKTSSESREYDTVINKKYRIEALENTNMFRNYRIIENADELPDWIPTSFDEAMEFDAEYGVTHIKDNYVCCVRRMTGDKENYSEYVFDSSEEYPEGSKSQLCKVNYVPSSGNKDGQYANLSYDVEVFRLQPSSEINITWNQYDELSEKYRKYTFACDENGTVTEKDIFGWLPDSVEEARNFNKDNGMVSVHDNYVVYCNIVNAGTGYEMDITTKGIARINPAEKYTFEVPSLVPLNGGAYAEVFLYKATKPGTATMTFDYGRSFEPEDKHKKTVQAFRFDDDLKAEMIKESELTPLISGDCNYDGAIGIADYITLKNWLHSGGVMECAENADMNNDGVIDVFDLIAIKKLLISGNTVFKGLEADPKPMLVGIYDNFAWGRQQAITVYDENGSSYSMHLSYGENDPDINIYNEPINMKNSDWYSVLTGIMKNDKAEKSVIPDDLTMRTKAVASEIEKYSEETGKTSRTVRFDGGTTTYYLIGEKSDGNPMFMEICQAGDVVSISNCKEIKEYLKYASYDEFFIPEYFYGFLGLLDNNTVS